MAGNPFQVPIRQVLFVFFRWLLPAVIVILFVLIPSWSARQPLWNSLVADWFFRILVTLVFSRWHYTHARIFTGSNKEALGRSQLPAPDQVVMVNGVVEALILTSQVLVGSLVIAYFTWFAITAFVPRLETWSIMIAVVHVCLVILPWLSYRRWNGRTIKPKARL